MRVCGWMDGWVVKCRHAWSVTPAAPGTKNPRTRRNGTTHTTRPSCVYVPTWDRSRGPTQLLVPGGPPEQLFLSPLPGSISRKADGNPNHFVVNMSVCLPVCFSVCRPTACFLDWHSHCAYKVIRWREELCEERHVYFLFVSASLPYIFNCLKPCGRNLVIVVIIMVVILPLRAALYKRRLRMKEREKKNERRTGIQSHECPSALTMLLSRALENDLSFLRQCSLPAFRPWLFLSLFCIRGSAVNLIHAPLSPFLSLSPSLPRKRVRRVASKTENNPENDAMEKAWVTRKISDRL
ncbi:hypothetical protein F5Y14DRAFT_64631 [Nemania sp. NC0429]|nr:hypothetical protein F5Y14DRAFT_64631 [Nemania sp. NC0429]